MKFCMNTIFRRWDLSQTSNSPKIFQKVAWRATFFISNSVKICFAGPKETAADRKTADEWMYPQWTEGLLWHS